MAAAKFVQFLLHALLPSVPNPEIELATPPSLRFISVVNSADSRLRDDTSFCSAHYRVGENLVPRLSECCRQVQAEAKPKVNSQYRAWLKGNPQVW